MEFSRRTGLAGLAAGVAATALPRVGRAAEPDIVIGAPNCLTGGLAPAGTRFVAALQIAVDKINAGGGIKSLGGARLKLNVADSTSDSPAQAASVTRRLIDQDGAVAICGTTASSLTLASQIECEKSSIPLITNSYADTIVQRGMKYTFKFMPQGNNAWNMAMDGVYAMYKAFTGAPPASCGIVTSNTAVGIGVQKALPAHAKSLGLPVLFTFGYTAGLADPSAIVVPVVQQKPAILFLDGYIADLLLCVKALRALGVTAPIVNGGSFYDDSVVGIGTAADRLLGVEAWNSDIPVPGNQELVEAYLKARPGSLTFNEQIGAGYACGLIIGQAVEKAASRDGARLREALATTEFTDLPVPAGKVKYGPDGLNLYNTGIICEWQNKVLHTVWPENLQTARPLL